jgi:WD40 repeat protein
MKAEEFWMVLAGNGAQWSRRHWASVLLLLALCSCAGPDQLVAGADVAADLDSTTGPEIRTDTSKDTTTDVLAATDVGGADGTDTVNGTDSTADQEDAVPTDTASDTDAGTDAETGTDAHDAGDTDSNATTDAQTSTDTAEDANAEEIGVDTDDSFEDSAADLNDTLLDGEGEPDSLLEEDGEPDAEPDSPQPDTVEPDIWPDTGPPVPPCAVGLDPQKVCLRWGVCAAGVELACDDEGMPYCDYAKIPNWGLFELSCDGLDNDCNKAIDDNPLGGGPASKLVGVCKGAKQVCTSSGFADPDWSQVKNYEAVETSCDGLDNDCDGQIDFLVVAPPLLDLPGVCGKVFLLCEGKQGWQPPPLGSIPAYQPQETACDGLDNDCDGLTDEGLWQVNFPGAGVVNLGVCKGAPLACYGGAWIAPWDHPQWPNLPGAADMPAMPTQTWQADEQACDGLDNDCDGVTDKDIFDPPPGPLDQGVCAGLTQLCNSSQGSWEDPNYDAVQGYLAGPELICDGKDNNCDGKTDESAACPMWQTGGRGSGQVALDPTGTRLVWTSMTGVHVTHVGTGLREMDHFGHSWEASDAVFSPDGDQIASVGRFDALRIYPAQAADGPPTTWPVDVAVQSLGTVATAVAWSKDGVRLALSDTAGQTRLYAANSGALLGTLSHGNQATAVAWVRSGPWQDIHVLAGDADGDILRWNAISKTSMPLATLPSAVRALATGPDSTHLVAVPETGTPLVYDTETARLLATLEGHTGPVRAAVVTGQGVALTLEASGLVRRWQLPVVPPATSPVVVAQLQASEVWTGAAVPPGDSAAGLAADATETVVGFVASGPWKRLQSGQWQALEGQAVDGLSAIAVSGGVVAAAHGDGTVRLRDALAGQQLAVVPGHDGGTTALALRANPGTAPLGTLADGALLATGGLDFAVRLWTVQPKLPVWEILNLKTFGLGGPWPEDLVGSVSGDSVWASAGNTAQRFAWSGPTAGNKLQAYAVPFGTTIETVRPSPDGQWLLVGMSGGTAVNGVVWRLLEATTLTTVWERADLPASRHVAAWHPTEPWIALSGGSQRLQRVDALTGETLALLLGHTGEIAALDWQMGDRLLSGSVDGTARVWRTESTTPTLSMTVLSRHCPAPCTLVPLAGAAVLDGPTRRAVTAGSDGSLIGWLLP